MRKSKITIGLGLLVVLVLVFTGSCTRNEVEQNEVEQLEGILQNVDAANGETTIVTEDGRTMTLDVDTEVTVYSQGSPSTLDALEVGDSIQVEVGVDNQVVQRIDVRQAEEDIEEDVEVEDGASNGENIAEVPSSPGDNEGLDGDNTDEQTISDDVEEVPVTAPDDDGDHPDDGGDHPDDGDDHPDDGDDHPDDGDDHPDDGDDHPDDGDDHPD